MELEIEAIELGPKRRKVYRTASDQVTPELYVNQVQTHFNTNKVQAERISDELIPAILHYTDLSKRLAENEITYISSHRRYGISKQSDQVLGAYLPFMLNANGVIFTEGPTESKIRWRKYFSYRTLRYQKDP